MSICWFGRQTPDHSPVCRYCFSHPTLSPSFPRIGYINLTHDELSISIKWLEFSLFSEAWNVRTMRWLQENGSRGSKTDICGEKRKSLIFCWCDWIEIFKYNIHLSCLKSYRQNNHFKTKMGEIRRWMKILQQIRTVMNMKIKFCINL